MSEHYVDVFDENYQWKGVALKSEAHNQGLWHRVFSCLIVDSTTRSVFFQKKQPLCYSFERPDYIDVSVGGHYIAGEKIEEGIREFKEETGIEIQYSDLINLGIRRSVFSIGDYKCFEYQHMHLYDLKGERPGFNGDMKEIKAFVEVNVDQAISLLLKDSYEIDAIQYYKNEIAVYKMTYNEIDPAYMTGDKLMLRLLIAALRYMQGEDKRLIFL